MLHYSLEHNLANVDGKPCSIRIFRDWRFQAFQLGITEITITSFASSLPRWVMTHLSQMTYLPENQQRNKIKQTKK